MRVLARHQQSMPEGTSLLGEKHGEFHSEMTIQRVLPVVLLFGKALDAGAWFFDHRVAQNQADVAVLVAAQHLPAVEFSQASMHPQRL